jgi:hypothetical protein
VGTTEPVRHRVVHLVKHVEYLQRFGEGPMGRASRTQVTARHMREEEVTFAMAELDIQRAIDWQWIERADAIAAGIDQRRTWYRATRPGARTTTTHDQHWGAETHTWRGDAQPELPTAAGE